MAHEPPARPPAGPYPAWDQAPPTGTDDPDAASLETLATPDLRGTIFFTVLLLMAIFGFWGLMYVELLNR
jgi:hypothetical protein